VHDLKHRLVTELSPGEGVAVVEFVEHAYNSPNPLASISRIEETWPE
jgi:hypothetical protein